MADLKENQMAARTAEFVRCIDASGNSGIITPANLLTNTFQDRGIVAEGFDFDNAKSGTYTVNKTNCTNQPYPGVGTLVSFNSTYKLQIFMCIAGDSPTFMRVSDVRSSWAPWRKIQSVSL